MWENTTSAGRCAKGAAALKNGRAVPQNVISNSSPRNMPEKWECMSTKAWTPLSAAAVFLRATDQESSHAHWLASGHKQGNKAFHALRRGDATVTPHHGRILRTRWPTSGWFHLHEIPTGGEPTGTESRWVPTSLGGAWRNRAWPWGKWCFGGMTKCHRVECGDGCAILWPR